MSSEIVEVGNTKNYTMPDGTPMVGQDAQWRCNVTSGASVTRGRWGAIFIEGCDEREFDRVREEYARAHGWIITSFSGPHCLLESLAHDQNLQTGDTVSENCTSKSDISLAKRKA